MTFMFILYAAVGCVCASSLKLELSSGARAHGQHDANLIAMGKLQHRNTTLGEFKRNLTD